MTTVVVSSNHVEIFGARFALKKSRVLARILRSAIRVSQSPRYLAAAIRDGEAQIVTIRDEIALASFITHVTKGYDELLVLDLANKNREMITETLH